MSVKTAATLMCNSASACLLLALFLKSHISICTGILTEGVQISRYENTTCPETTIPQGTLQGINMVTRYNRIVSGFIGIPYAEPPVGDLRLLPVMVYIIGGEFLAVNISIQRFGPDFLLDEDIVLVIPCFRVGVLGYLSTGDEVSPGNYGLKDIVRALEWVQENIQYFGGDSDQVTSVGGSSGAMSIHLLTLSNSTNGLFHKYITQSGTALLRELNQPKEFHANRAIRLGEYLGCPTNTSTVLIECLRTFNASRLVDTLSMFYVWGKHPPNVWIPTYEPNIEGALLTDLPAKLYAAGNSRDLPWIVTVTQDEGLMTTIGEFNASKFRIEIYSQKSRYAFYEDPDYFEDFLNNIDLALPAILGYGGTINDEAAYTNALKSYYLNDLTVNRSLLLINLTQLIGDSSFVYPAYNAIQQKLVFGKSPMYFGYFRYQSTLSHTYLASKGFTRYTTVTHGDEMHYLFKNHDFRFAPPDAEYSETDLVMVDTMVQLWTSFVINGCPATLDSVSTTTWVPYSSDNNYLQIGNGSDTALEMKYDLLLERMQFWDELTKATAASDEFLNSPQVLC